MTIADFYPFWPREFAQSDAVPIYEASRMAFSLHALPAAFIVAYRKLRHFSRPKLQSRDILFNKDNQINASTYLGSRISCIIIPIVLIMCSFDLQTRHLPLFVREMGCFSQSDWSPSLNNCLLCLPNVSTVFLGCIRANSSLRATSTLLHFSPAPLRLAEVVDDFARQRQHAWFTG